MRLLLLLTVVLAGCIDTGTETTTLALSAAGTPLTNFEGRGGVQISLDRADLAFGPIYLCTGETPGDLCDESVASFTDAIVVDALSEAAQPMGPMDALSPQVVRSYMFDYGLVSLLTQETPLALPAADSLGGVSAVLEGRVESDGQSLAFEVAVPISQSSDEQGLPLVRNALPNTDFEIPPAGAGSLMVRFNAQDWLATANLAALFEDRDCTPGVSQTCRGALEQTCADDGTVQETRDCASTGQACVAGQGCTDSVTFASGSQVQSAVRLGLTAGVPPRFEFSR